MPQREFLERRNALWRQLRALSAEDDFSTFQEFEAALRELSELIGWKRERVLAGLGLNGALLQEQP